MFFWVTLPKSINTRAMFKKAVAKKVAYVVGDAFYPDASQANSMRLNFSYSTNEDLREGIKRLGEVIKEELKAQITNGEQVGEGV
jgi:2-aminoadipate transaminase